jgi:hypothetical protein
LILANVTVLGAVFNLNHAAHVVHWHFIKLPLANVIVIAAMLVVFALALLLPFPGSSRRESARRAVAGGTGSTS